MVADWAISRREAIKTGLCAAACAAVLPSVGCARQAGALDDVVGPVENDASLIPSSERPEVPTAGDLGPISSFGVRMAGALMEGNIEGSTVDGNTVEGNTTDRNVLYSPASAYFALSLAALGVQGVTQSELLDALGIADADSLADACQTALEELDWDWSDCRIALANSIWSDVRWEFTDAYTARVRERLGARAESVDFGTGEANEAIAQWVQDETDGFLQPTFAFSPETAAVLVNSLYFKASWQSDMFGEGSVARGVFHTASTEREVDFIHDVSFGNYGVFKGAIVASLPFRRAAEMTFILPDEGVDPREILADELTFAGLLGAERTGHGDIHWAIPKFDLNSGSMSLMQVLKGLGVNALFDGSVLGDFDGMLQLSGGASEAAKDMDPYVSDVVQGARISLDEYGVEAAAYTYEALAGEAEDLEPPRPLRMVLDRPFAFAIRDYEGTLLFVGVVEDPTA